MQINLMGIEKADMSKSDDDRTEDFCLHTDTTTQRNAQGKWEKRCNKCGELISTWR